MFKEPLSRAAHVARWVALAFLIGVLSGLLSAAFIQSLEWATDTRHANDWLVLTLPFAGLIVGCSYHYLGRGLERGSNLIIHIRNGFLFVSHQSSSAPVCCHMLQVVPLAVKAPRCN